MKINEVEAAVGVTKKNIRFYEEEGLITPGREPGNGYRSYSQTDVERLRRIKLLRKLDVPLAEIREMLEGQSTLAEGMNRQLERLSTRRKDLEEAIGFCTLLRQEPGSLEQLDVEQTLARLTARAPPHPGRLHWCCPFCGHDGLCNGDHGLGSLHRPAGCPAAAAACGDVRHPGGVHRGHIESSHRPH